MGTNIKTEVLQLIEAIDNDDLLQLIKADIELFSDSEKDVTDDLSDKDKEELKRLAGEPATNETISEEDFIKATARWRIR